MWHSLRSYCGMKPGWLASLATKPQARVRSSAEQFSSRVADVADAERSESRGGYSNCKQMPTVNSAETLRYILCCAMYSGQMRDMHIGTLLKQC